MTYNLVKNLYVTVMHFTATICFLSDLFQQVIPMGGNAECAWAITDKQHIVNVCQKFARKLGWNGTVTGISMIVLPQQFPLFLYKRPF